MQNKRRSFNRALLAGALAAAGMAASHPALADGAGDYPGRPVKIVVGFTPGGATDIFAREMAAQLSRRTGQQFIVENKPGAGSNIASEYAAKAAPDGYTLYMVAITSAINMSLYKKPGFNLVNDFAPVALVVKAPNVLVVHPSVPAKSVKELIDLARANPGKLNYASSGSGTSIHLSAEKFKMQTGTFITHIPYKGSSPALSDLLGGQVHLMFDNLPPSLPHVKAGKLRALAVTTAARAPQLPDVPTMQEAGVPDFDVSSWFGLIAPAATPKPILARLVQESRAIIESPEIRQKFADQGAVPGNAFGDDFGSFIKDEVGRWAKVVKASGATVD